MVIDHHPHRGDSSAALPARVLGPRRRLSGGPARQYAWGCSRVIEGTGELDLQVLPLLASLCAGAPPHVVFDLRRVTFLDAGVLGVLVGMRARQDRGDGAVRLVGPSPMVRRIIAITGLESVLPSFETWQLAAAGHESCPAAAPPWLPE